MNTCKKSCCWSPFGVCGKRQACACHTGHQPISQRISALELERAKAISKMKVGRR